MTKAVQTLVGPGRISSECNSVTFHNLESMTGGVTTQPNPDLFDGALLGDVDAGIREKLDGQIIPSKNARVPVVPNFFLEAKTYSDCRCLEAGMLGWRARRSRYTGPTERWRRRGRVS